MYPLDIEVEGSGQPFCRYFFQSSDFHILYIYTTLFHSFYLHYLIFYPILCFPFDVSFHFGWGWGWTRLQEESRSCSQVESLEATT